jgi:signal transduction histidine kinase
MTADDAGPGAISLHEKLRRSLSAKLLALTICFVLFAEFVLLVPSVATQRLDWFRARIEAAYLVSLALEAPQAEMITPEQAARLFSTADILGVMANRDGANVLLLAPNVDFSNPPRTHHIDLRDRNFIAHAADAWGTALSHGDDLVRVVGAPAYAPQEIVDILVSQRGMRRDLLAYARNILLLSLFISSVTGGLLFFALNQMIVRPVRRLTRAMAAFQVNPEDPRRIISPSARSDEIGTAERSLEALERRITELLSQRRRLAALGAGVSKITHDLRNILASAQLMSDRLASSEDPRVRKLVPRLIQSLDRAIALSRDALSFARMEPAALTKTRFPLAALVDEAFDDVATQGVEFVNDVPPDLEATADRNQLYRAIFNIARNAVEALAGADGGQSARPARLSAAAVVEPGRIRLTVADTGQGVPAAALTNLFEPFKGSTKAGGTGLGLAIAQEILKAHGGELRLARNGPEGATFELILPA